MGEIVKRAGLVVARRKRRKTEPYTEPLAHEWLENYEADEEEDDRAEPRLQPDDISDSKISYYSPERKSHEKANHRDRDPRPYLLGQCLRRNVQRLRQRQNVRQEAQSRRQRQHRVREAVPQGRRACGLCGRRQDL